MLENARRQTILVLLTILVGVACSIFLKPGFGPDLKGGNQLIYIVEEDILNKLTQGDKHTTVDDIMSHTVRIIRERIDPTGTLDALVSRRGHNGILIELPWRESDELDAIKQRISSLGKLEMRVVAIDGYVSPDGKVSFNQMAQEKRKLTTWLNDDNKAGWNLVLDDLRNIDRYNDDPNNGPIAGGTNLRWVPYLITPESDKPTKWSAPLGMGTPPEGVPSMENSVVNLFDLQKDYNGGQVPESFASQKEPRLVQLIAINWYEEHFTGEDLDPAGISPGFSQEGRLAVHYKVQPARTSAYGDWSGKHKNRHSAIILNGIVKSAPYFVDKITSNGQISGNFTQAEVDDLVKVLRTGSLRVEPTIQSDHRIGPTLGATALWFGEVSLLAGAAAVFLFMLWYYKLAGVVACVTLILNVFLLWASVLFMQATITLPGLGGIVLTMGMAVDANVLIYERIREEHERGKDMLRAVRAGFERAMSAILDSNITTFLTGLVLYNVGVGPVRGFAVTLMVGIITTVFTQFFVTRLLFHWLLETKRLNDFKVRRLLAQPKWDYLKYAKACFAGSILVIVLGVGYAAFGVPTEISLGIDFKGGANMQMLVQTPMSTQALVEKLDQDEAFKKDFRYFQVNTIEEDKDGRSRLFNIRLKLTTAMREQIEHERTDWRELRRAAEARNEEPPAEYQAPYLVHLRRIFGQDLAKNAFSDAEVIEGSQNNAFAQIMLHFQNPVRIADAQEMLAKAKLGRLQVYVPGDDGSVRPVNDEIAAGTAKDVFVEWVTQPATRKSSLFPTVRKALTDLKDASGEQTHLSNPFPEAEEIQGRMVGELKTAAIGALILSWALIIFYLRARFHEYRYGIAAVVALIHDVLVSLAAVVLFNKLGWVHAEIDLNMIACFLTIIGYSVNDTIVIFDRIRENLNEQQKLGGSLSLRELINLSINQTMSRTILTSGVTLFVVIAQFAVNWGTDSGLESFAFGMMVGMISGTYSTVFIACPVLTWIGSRAKPAAPQPAQPVAVS